MIFLLVLAGTAYSQLAPPSSGGLRITVMVSMDEPFLSYSGKISWSEEQHYLDNFRLALERNPDMIGYIGFYSGGGMSEKEITARIKRAVEYLLEKKIRREDLSIKYLGDLEESKIVLQPIDRNEHPPW